MSSFLVLRIVSIFYLKRTIDNFFLSLYALSGSFSSVANVQSVQQYHGMPQTCIAGLIDLITDPDNAWQRVCRTQHFPRAIAI